MANVSDGTQHNGLLLYFLADVLRSDDLLGEFLADPEAVMRKYDLSDEQAGAVFSLSPAAIAAIVQSEVAANVRRAISFDYPVPEVKIENIEPLQVMAGRPTALTVSGEALMARATVLFTETTQGHRFSFKATKGSGEFQRRRIQVTIELPKGAYRVSLLNTPDASEVPANQQIKAT